MARTRCTLRNLLFIPVAVLLGYAMAHVIMNSPMFSQEHAYTNPQGLLLENSPSLLETNGKMESNNNPVFAQAHREVRNVADTNDAEVKIYFPKIAGLETEDAFHKRKGGPQLLKFVYRVKTASSDVNATKTIGDKYTFFDQKLNSSYDGSNNTPMDKLMPGADNKSVLTNTVQLFKTVKDMLKSNIERFHSTQVNCAAILNGDEALLNRTYLYTKWYPSKRGVWEESEQELPGYYVEETKQCDIFTSKYGFIMDSLTQEERDYPIAFSVLTYSEINLMVRMLSAVYRPQNYYCIHVDIGATPDYHQAMRNIASCLPNVIMAATSHNITWGNWTIVEAELTCMRQLYQQYSTWRYFINLTGQEFPLKTNFELVKILKAFNGANDVDGGIWRRRFFRWDKQPTPAGITPYQGSTHIVVNREFVHFVLFSPTSLAMQAWLRPSKVPDETFFATMNHNPHLHIRGSYNGNLSAIESECQYCVKPSFSRYKMWFGSGPCGDPRAWSRGVCVLTLGDLQRITSSPFMFANKFHIYRDPFVIGCLEEWFANRTLAFYLGKDKIDTTIYEQSTIVKDQIM